MARNRRGSERRAMEGQVLVRLDVPLDEALDRAADLRGCHRATAARELLRGALSDNAAQVPGPVRVMAARRPSPDVVALASVGADLARTCGALVQLAKALRLAGPSSSALHADAERVLGEARATQAVLRDRLRDGQT